MTPEHLSEFLFQKFATSLARRFWLRLSHAVADELSVGPSVVSRLKPDRGCRQEVPIPTMLGFVALLASEWRARQSHSVFSHQALKS